MHRHGYQQRKFGREKDQRRALLKSLANSLVLEESIETTLPKAKSLIGYTEKLITKAKKNDLHNRRQLISQLASEEAANKLVDDIAPLLASRPSGHLRIKRLGLRRGDNAQMAKISFVDDLTAKKPAEKPAANKKAPAGSKTAKPGSKAAPKKTPVSKAKKGDKK